MGNYLSFDFDDLRDLQIVLEDAASDIAQVLPDVQDQPDTVMYFLKAFKAKAIELDPNQQQKFEITLRYLIAGMNSRLGEGSGNNAVIAKTWFLLLPAVRNHP